MKLTWETSVQRGHHYERAGRAVSREVEAYPGWPRPDDRMALGQFSSFGPILKPMTLLLDQFIMFDRPLNIVAVPRT